MDSLRCLLSADSNITLVDQVYRSEDTEGALWLGTGVPPTCSTISPPAPSTCLVCLQKMVYAVCNNVTSALTMEGEGEEIRITDSECPVFMKNDPNLHLLLLLLIPIILAVAVVYWKRAKICEAWQRYKERKLQRAQNGSFMQTIRRDEAETAV